MFGLVLSVADGAMVVICGWWLCVHTVCLDTLTQTEARWYTCDPENFLAGTGISEHAPTRPVGTDPRLQASIFTVLLMRVFHELEGFVSEFLCTA